MKLALCGLMKSGKDTAAEYLLSKRPSGIITKFADPLYRLQTLIYNELDLDLPSDGKDRSLLQLLGTEWGRERNPDIWVNQWVKEFRMLNHEDVYVTDVRFPNEVRAVQNEGFLIIYVWAEEEIRIARGAKSLPDHESERLMKLWGDEFLALGSLGCGRLVIENNGRIEEFYAKLDLLVQNIG